MRLGKPLHHRGSATLAAVVVALLALGALAPRAAAEDVPTRYALQSVTELSGALDSLRSVQRKVGQPEGPSTTTFRTSAVVLLAGDLARKAGNLTVARTLGSKCSAIVGGRSTETLEQLQQDKALKTFIATANGEVPGGDGRVLTEGEWTQGLEKE